MRSGGFHFQHRPDQFDFVLATREHARHGSESVGFSGWLMSAPDDQVNRFVDCGLGVIFQIRPHFLFDLASIRGVLIAMMPGGVFSSVLGPSVLPCPIPLDPATGRRGGLGT